jgi:tryptophan synthase alpha chain
MSRIATAFEQQAFVGYLTGGEPVECYHALLRGGVDLLEIGIPFSDPIGEGPVIQQAMERTLAAGTSTASVLDLVAELRQQSEVPIVVMSYYNPIYSEGAAFYQEAAAVGVDGVLVVDLPVEEAVEHVRNARENGLDTIFLATPGMSAARLTTTLQVVSGFLYYACRQGTTGVQQQLPTDITTNLDRLKAATDLPVAVGFGIGDQASAAAVLRHADGFIVGSAFIDRLNQGGGPDDLYQLARQIDPRGEKN